MNPAAPSPDSASGEERLPISPALGCVVSVAAGLICAAGFFSILWFNQQGQIVYEPAPFRATRVWLLRGVEGRGLGVSTTRPVEGGTTDRVCAQTTVRFYFLAGRTPEADTAYCECFTRSESGWVAAGSCPG